MGRPPNTDERKAQIVDGLMRAMAERGYEGASIGAIAEAAGLAPGLVHYHFKTKQDVLIALVDHLALLLEARFADEISRAEETAPARLKAFLDAHVALGKGADPAAVACWVAIGAEAVRQKEVRAVYSRVVERRLDTLTALLRDVLEMEGRATSQVRAHAAALLSSVDGMFQLSIAAPEVLPRGFASRAVMDLAQGLISSTPFAWRARS